MIKNIIRFKIIFVVIMFSLPSFAQTAPPGAQSRSQLQSSIGTSFPDNTGGYITPYLLRNFLTNLTNSAFIWDTDSFTNVFSNLYVGATTQANINQIFEVTAPYTNLNASSDIVRIQLGSFPITDELSGTNGSYSNWGLAVGTQIPAGSFTGIPTWPSGGIAAYVLGSNAEVGAVASYAAGGSTVPNVPVDAINAVTVNCNIQACLANNGLDVGTNYAVESDTVVKAKPGGLAPAGNFTSFIAIANADIQPSATLSAFATATVNLPYQDAFASNTGAASIGLDLGSVSASNSSASQGILLNSINSSGTIELASIEYDASQNFILTNGATGQQFGMLNANPYWIMNQYAAGAQAALKVYNSATTTNTEAGIIFQTGSTASDGQINTVNGNYFSIMSDTGLPGGIVLTSSSGVIQLVGVPVSGTAAGSVCVSSGNKIYIKTTTGSCL